jgi:hypothetical protein
MRRHALIADHLVLVLILIIFSALTLYQSIVLPLGEADDETDHYQYLRFVARTGHPPLTESERREAGFKGGLAPLYYWLVAWPVALVGESSSPDVRRVDARPERHIPGDGLGINHVMHTIDEQWPWQGQTLAWHLVRFLSLPMAWVTIIATYALGRSLVPRLKIVAIGAAAFVAFLPRFVIGSAAISDDNLVLALIALLLLVQIFILQRGQPPGVRIMVIFGALFGLSLVTKYFSLILIPEIILVLWLVTRKPGASRRSTSIALLAFVAALMLTAGLWFIFIVVRFNRIAELGLIPGLAAALGEPQVTEGLIGLLSGQVVRPVAATYSLGPWFGLFYRSFWFEYGWMQLFAPRWLYALFTIFLVVVLLGLIRKIRTNDAAQKRKAGDAGRPGSIIAATVRSSQIPSHSTWLLVLHVLLFVLVLLARYVLSATIDTAQGRHLYPALPVIALLAALGIYFAAGWAASFRVSRWLTFAGMALLFLVPAVILLGPGIVVQDSRLALRHAPFILPFYRTLAVSATPILLPVEQRQSIEFDDRLWLLGLDVPGEAIAGQTLPVTLYWAAENEAGRDYLVSLCLQDDAARPVACWRGNVADGRYPARAWEPGDTVIDRIHIPIPRCYELTDQSYRLKLEIYPADPASPAPSPLSEPLLGHTFLEPEISIRPTDLSTDPPQTVELWQADRRLSQPTELEAGQALAQIHYNRPDPESFPAFTRTNGVTDRWLPLPAFDTPLYLPCRDGPEPAAYQSHFIVHPTLTSGTYRSTSAASLPDLSLTLRNRRFAPITTTLSFSDTLSPRSVQLPDQPPADLIDPALAPGSQTAAYVLDPSSNAQLPVTVRWQSRRWMAEPLIVSVKLLDKDFNVADERVAALGGRYPNVLWVPTELVEESYPVTLEPDAPPGRYFLELSLIRQDERLPNGFEYLPLSNNGDHPGPNLYPLTIRLLDPAHDSQPAQPLEAELGDVVRLVGYDLNPAFSDSPPRLELALYWTSTGEIPIDYTVFTQVVDQAGQVWAQWDNPPQAGRLPTSTWSARDSVVDRYNLQFQQGAPAGDYRLLVGMYEPTTGERLPVTIDGQPQPNHAIELTTISFDP